MGSNSVRLESVEVAARLRVSAVDCLSATERAARPIQDRLGGLLAGSGAPALVSDELTPLPGFAEFGLLAHVVESIRREDADVLIVDSGRLRDLARLLALPERVAWYVERVLPRHWRLVRSSGGGSGQESMMDSLAAVVTALADWVASIQSSVDSPHGPAVRFVVAPEHSSVEDARRAGAHLGLLGVRPDGLVVNRVIPGDSSDADQDPWLAAVRPEQARAVAAARETFPEAPLRTASYRARPPEGVDELDDLAVEIYGDVDPAALTVGARSVAAWRVDRGMCAEAIDGTEFVWALPIPHAVREDVSLARVDDSLAVTVAGFRRLIPLPSVLRRCAVHSAAYTSDELRVRFRPDPALWPKG